MAHIQVEKQPTGSNTGWAWVLGALVVAGIIAAVVFGLWNGADRTAGLYDPNVPTSTVVYQGGTWQVRGEAVNYPDRQMKVVGQTAEGYKLYANTEQGYTQGGGGGGGEITPGTAPQPYGRIYLKTTDGRYMPLFKQ